MQEITTSMLVVYFIGILIGQIVSMVIAYRMGYRKGKEAGEKTKWEEMAKGVNELLGNCNTKIYIRKEADMVKVDMRP